MANGVVYIGSTDGNVYALNASTGALKLWNLQSPMVRVTLPRPQWRMEWSMSAPDGDVYALDASTGAMLWSYLPRVPEAGFRARGGEWGGLCRANGALTDQLRSVRAERQHRRAAVEPIRPQAMEIFLTRSGERSGLFASRARTTGRTDNDCMR